MLKIKFQQKSQSGRSMVEMLGVLAVIGILSIGGIYGYRMAILKNTENKILALTDKFYLWAKTELYKKDSILKDETATDEDLGHAFCDFAGQEYCNYPVENRPYKFFINPQTGVDADDGIKWAITIDKALTANSSIDVNPDLYIPELIIIHYLTADNTCERIIETLNGTYGNLMLAYRGNHQAYYADEAISNVCERRKSENARRGQFSIYFSDLLF